MSRSSPPPGRSARAAMERSGDDRGHEADAPHEIPARGWKDILLRTIREFREDQAPLVAAGVTFYVLLAVFPALTTLVSLYGLFADVTQVGEHVARLAGIVPREGIVFLSEQMTRIAGAADGGLSLAFLGGLVLSLWSANGATRAVITALNIAYEEEETRPFLRRTLLSLAFTVGGVIFVLAALFVIGAPSALEPYIGPMGARLLAWLSWPAILLAAGLGLALLYRHGPSRDDVKWSWLSWGSAAALALWLAVSAAFSIYVSNFAHYEKTYGSLGAVIGLMMWVYLSTQVVLFGAELNSEIEHQTVRDTTVGPERPLGARGAVMADTVGEPQGS